MTDYSNRFFTGQSVKQLDKIAVEEFGIPSYELMNRAGQAAYRALRSNWPSAKKVAIICGTGNNGGDGFVLGRILLEKDLGAIIYQIDPSAKLSETAELAKQDYLNAKGRIEKLPDSGEFSADVVVDALLGTGLRAPLKSEWLLAIQRINQSYKPVLAIDLPSGIDGDTGAIIDFAVKAHVTISFLGAKLALVTGPAADYAGLVLYSDLGVPPEVFDRVAFDAVALDLSMALKALPARKPSAHKGEMGHTLVVGGGEVSYSGAVCMASSAALSSGAGLVSAFVHPDAMVMMSRAPMELMCYTDKTSKILQSLLAKINVVVLGPGLTQSPWAMEQFKTVVSAKKPMVIDADGLNWLAENPVKCENWVLTPHPGEAARLLGISTEAVQAYRLGAAKRLQEKYGGVIVLKGNGTIIATRDKPAYVCLAGNPGMATGGMGDILAGLIGSLIGQGLTLWDAAKLAVITHALAGDIEQDLGQRGMLASDLLLHIRTLLNPFEDHEQPEVKNIFDTI